METATLTQNRNGRSIFTHSPIIETVDYEVLEPEIILHTEDVDDLPIADVEETNVSTLRNFIMGTTQEIDIKSLHEDHLIPCFSKDGEECISHVNFILSLFNVVKKYYHGQVINEPVIRVSHQNTMRTRTGAGKLVSQLTEQDYGTYFERLIVMIEIPSISTEIDGQKHSLMVCGVRNYADTNLLSTNSTSQVFKLGVGFICHCCHNGVISTDGLRDSIKVNSTQELEKHALELLSNFSHKKMELELKSLCHTNISESQFCTILGRIRLYSYLSAAVKEELGILDLFILTEAQINSATRDYIEDPNFKSYGGELNAFKMLNILNGWKNSQIDKTLIRTTNAFEFTKNIAEAINGVPNNYSWFLQ